MKYRLTADHYKYNRILEKDTLVGDDTPYPWRFSDGSPMEPSMNMEPLDAEAKEAFAKKWDVRPGLDKEVATVLTDMQPTKKPTPSAPPMPTMAKKVDSIPIAPSAPPKTEAPPISAPKPASNPLGEAKK